MEYTLAKEAGTLDTFKFDNDAFKVTEVTKNLEWEGEIDWNLT